MERAFRGGPWTFESFPDGSVCPVCGTNDDGACVLVPIQGTSDGSISEAQPFHLACAIPNVYRRKTAGDGISADIIYRAFEAFGKEPNDTAATVPGDSGEQVLGGDAPEPEHTGSAADRDRQDSDNGRTV